MTQTSGSDQTYEHLPRTTTPLLHGLALAQELAARISHDLAGLVGNLVGTLELAQSDPCSFALAQETAQALQGRLKLLRAAFGGTEPELSFAQLQRLLAAMPLSRRVSLNLALMPQSEIWSAAQARLLLCVVMLAVEALAGDGEVVMQQDDNGAVLLAAIGPRAIWPAGFAGFVADPTAAFEHATDQGPRGVLGPLVALLAHSVGAHITLLIGAHSETAPPLLITFPA